MSRASRKSTGLLPRFGAGGRAVPRREPQPPSWPAPENPRLPRRPDRDTLPWWLAGSLAVHSGVLAVLLLDLMPRREGPESLPAPAIEMVFESGDPTPQASGAPEGEAPEATEPPQRAESPPPSPPTPDSPPAPPALAEAQPAPPQPAPPQPAPPPRVPQPPQPQPPQPQPPQPQPLQPQPP
ncbi:hypothetical protein EOD42_19265, partial [Rhodovarius crocodyli]